jgi:thioredoxin 1
LGSVSSVRWSCANNAPSRLRSPKLPLSAARLVELGSTSCRSCKAMHEELALLREECSSIIAVEEIDVWRDEEAGRRYGVNVIPTQVFLDAEGRELDRHTGFLARADIRARFAARGHECRP